MKINVKSVAISVVSLVSICAVASFLLAMTNSATQKVIENLAQEKETQNRKMVLQEAKDFSHEGKTISLDGTNYVYYQGYDENENIVGYVFTTVVKGYSGDIRVMTGVGTDNTVKGVRILELSETAGLGMNAQNDSFLTQYKGLKSEIELSSGASNSDNTVDALTGATITSNAVTDAVNIALSLNEAVQGGEEND